jgi:hypothetical protein
MGYILRPEGSEAAQDAVNAVFANAPVERCAAAF